MYVWNAMMDCVHSHYLDAEVARQISQAKLNEVIIEAWESISSVELMQLISSMSARSQIVVEAKCGPVKYLFNLSMLDLANFRFGSDFYDS